jgi:predicted nucleic acid-binding protein
MATISANNGGLLVVDASAAVSISAREVGNYQVALARMQRYERDGRIAHAPGVIVSECLFALCRKLETGSLAAARHTITIRRLRHVLAALLPPPQGDASLAVRAEEIRRGNAEPGGVGGAGSDRTVVSGSMSRC